ncbi:MAG: vWA domain-containing protein, partial [Gaiellaceae bacterium]
MIETLTRFGRALREEGLDAGPGRIADFCRAAALLAPGDLYWAGRATLVGRGEEIPVYDEVFRRFFGAAPEGEQRRPIRVHVVVEAERERGLASPVELLREKSFARCSREELAALAGPLGGLTLRIPSRRTRRLERAREG